MKKAFLNAPCLLLAAWVLLPGCAVAETPPETLRQADDALRAAMLSADAQALDQLLSADLHFAHSNGKVDTKQTLVASLTSGGLAYQSLEYLERKFTFPAEAIGLMTGKIAVRATSGANRIDLTMGVLAVWRKEAGTWRLLARQSCAIPSASASGPGAAPPAGPQLPVPNPPTHPEETKP